MNSEPDSPLLKPGEGPPVRVLNPAGTGQVVLVCEHASRFIPAALGGLGLTPEAQSAHVAWDIGAMDLALELMGEFDAPLVAGRVSRLVYDCNRPPEAADAIPARSERFEVPGNASLSNAARAARAAAVYHPFRAALAATLAAHRAHQVALVTVHSFTPVYMGRTREVELGLLHDDDPRLAGAMLEAAAHTGLRAALNEPYDASDGVTHTLRVHALPARLPNVMIEVRNDLLGEPASIRKVAHALAGMLRSAMADTLAPAATGSGG